MTAPQFPQSRDFEARLPLGLQRFLAPGCRVWPVDADEFGRAGHIVVWPADRRAGVHWGNEVLFGHWHEDREVIQLDADEYLEVSVDGRILDTRVAA